MLALIFSTPLLLYLFIFLARVSDMSLDVFRVLLLTRGYSLPAGVIGFFEVIIYIVALGTVMQGGISDLAKVVAYAAGFATGNFLGAYFEKKMAVGYVVIQVFPAPKTGQELLERLRVANFGVTVLLGEGASGSREVLVVTAKRKSQDKILAIMNEVDPDTFFHISDIRTLQGGVFPNK
ncbi:MAG: DUF2179 domain-containing protein [Desulfitobacteriaceae bacterium]